MIINHKLSRYLKLVLPAVMLCCLLIPKAAHAEKTITLSSSTTSVEVGQTIDIPIAIDTNGEKVNAVGFTIDFPTETLEGLVPNRAGSAFPFWVTESATRVDCGIQGQQGFTGTGTVTTLRFKGRTEGTANISLRNIKVLFAGVQVADFSGNDISITVYSSGATPATVDDNKAKKTLTIPQTSAATAPVPTANSQTINTIPSPTQTFGSLAQVKGTTGSTAEDTLKPAGSSETVASVKGIFAKGSMLWSSILPTMILLIIVIFLGIRLYLSERRQHLNAERMFDKQLGTLAALESKIDIITQNGAEGREQYLKDIEAAKSDLFATVPGSKTNVTASDQPTK